MVEMHSHLTFSCQTFFKLLYWLSCILLTSSIRTCSALVTASSRNQSDRFALLAFKSEITDDPLQALSSWNDSLHHCDWRGVTCSRRHTDRVTILDLQFQKLNGALSPYIGNLTFLRRIRLSQNYFHGEIPPEIGRLSRLQYLSLNNNSFVGGIPINVTRCLKLIELDLVDNKLTGDISPELSSLSKLTGLFLAKNSFSGFIPPSLGNLSSLYQISLSDNRLKGNIPKDLCHILSLGFLQVSGNNLTGNIPSCLYNSSNMFLFSVVDNQLEGKLPSDIGLTLPNIRELYLGLNNFSGLIPTSISNASRLETLALSRNLFTGPLPRDLGRLPNLQRLEVHRNQLGTEAGDDFEFITSMTNCSNLEIISVGQNILQGPLPDSISNLSTTITYLWAGENQMYGSIPAGIAELVNIEGLYLNMGYLTGNIPPVIGKLNKLRELHLESNMLTGQIPSFDNLTQLTTLVLGSNNFSGSIPRRFGNILGMEVLDLSDNNLTGTIPRELLRLSSLMLGLYLERNSLTGSLPPEVGNSTNLLQLIVSHNKLSGPIPESLGGCLGLEQIFLDNNHFQGEIPDSLITLQGLEYLDLSQNNLSGEIPDYLKGFPLLYLNLSFNQLQGQVPRNGVFRNVSLVSIEGNKGLCGGVSKFHLPPCIQEKKETSRKRKKPFSIKVIIPVILGSLCLLIFSCVLLLCYRRTVLKKKTSSTTSFNEQYKRVTYGDLIRATNGFSTDNLIGIGSYGSVFKGMLQDTNKPVAVKVLNLQREGASKSFLTECNALRNLRHRNLVKIITSCSSVDFQGNDFKALVFEFMPNGSLDELLHPRKDVQLLESRNLNFIHRLNIAIDIAYALEYLHNRCEPEIVHCDLKPSNVLLDDDMTAHVADFGIAKIYNTTAYDSTQSIASSVVIKGSIGYVAPEYGMGSEVSKQGDVYSYGILLLEMFTRKKPTDDMFSNGRSLHNYAKLAIPNEVEEIADPMVMSDENAEGLTTKKNGRLVECLVAAIRVGVRCSAASPVERMAINEVLTELLHIRDRHQG